METDLCTNRCVQHRPALSAGLQQRIERDFLPRWTRDWGGRSLLEGLAPGPNAVRLDGNDYLAVTGHPDIVAAQVKALMQGTQSVVQSSVFQRDDHPARALERELAQWTGREDALLCQSGYAANLGALQCFADAQTPVYIDTMAHPSLWEGVRAAGATARPFRHNDPQHLDRLMDQHGPGLVVVDAIYSTTGAVCPTETGRAGEQFDLDVSRDHHAEHLQVIDIVIQKKDAAWTVDERKCQWHGSGEIGAGGCVGVCERTSGSSMVNTAPFPDCECTLSLPRASSTTFLQKLRPRPLPAPAWVE